MKACDKRQPLNITDVRKGNSSYEERWPNFICITNASKNALCLLLNVEYTINIFLLSPKLLGELCSRAHWLFHTSSEYITVCWRWYQMHFFPTKHHFLWLNISPKNLLLFNYSSISLAVCCYSGCSFICIQMLTSRWHEKGNSSCALS